MSVALGSTDDNEVDRLSRWTHESRGRCFARKWAQNSEDGQSRARWCGPGFPGGAHPAEAEFADPGLTICNPLGLFVSRWDGSEIQGRITWFEF